MTIKARTSVMPFFQDTGLAQAISPSGPPNGTAVKALGGGLVLLLTIVQASLNSVMPWAVLGMWAMWMVLGFARAMAQGEKLCLKKAYGGAWKLLGAFAIFAFSLFAEAIVAEQGQQIPIAAGVLGFIAVHFGIRVADAASYFFPGLRETLAKIAPSVFAPKPTPPITIVRNEEAS